MDNGTNVATTDPGPSTVATVFVTLQFVIMMLILSGNTLVLIAYSKFRHLQTVTGKFVANLAVSDLVLGLMHPFQIAFFFHPELEKIEYACLLRFQSIYFTTTVSLISLLCTVVDRFIAIVMPLRYHMIMSDKMAYIMIVTSWLYAAMFTSLPFFGLNTWDMAPFCLFELVMSSQYRLACALHTIILSVVMFIIYMKIFHVAWNHYKRIRAEEIVIPNASQMHKDSKMAQVMALVVLSFTLAWLPFCLIQIFQTISFSVNKAIAGNFAVFLGIANSTINPVIYVWKNKEYRKAFKLVLSCTEEGTEAQMNTVTSHVPTNHA